MATGAAGFHRLLTASRPGAGGEETFARAQSASMSEWGAGASTVPTEASAVSTLELAGLEEQFEAVARRVASSVVAISVAARSRGEDDTVRPDDMTAARLGELLQRTTRTVGTGFVIDASGLILTNEHVIADAEQIWCTTDAGRVLPAFVVGSDPRSDLAVLRVPATVPLAEVAFAEGPVRRGQWAIALGNPYGLAAEGRLSLSVGVVSAVGRSLPRLSSRENRVYRDLIQTTAEINPGNSGGPLFDLQGRVIGINTAVVLPQKNTNGIGFAMPISAALLSRVELLRQGIEVPYVQLGVTVAEPSARQRSAAAVEEEIGVVVEAVDRSGPPGGALRVGDLILGVNGSVVEGLDAWAAAVATLRPGTPARVALVRGGRPMTVIVTPQRRSMPTTPVTAANQRYRWKGMLLGPIPDHWQFEPGTRPEFGLMVLATDPGAAGALPPGTIVQSLGGRPLRTVADLQNALATTTPELSHLGVYSPRAGSAVTDLPTDR